MMTRIKGWSLTARDGCARRIGEGNELEEDSVRPRRRLTHRDASLFCSVLFCSVGAGVFLLPRVAELSCLCLVMTRTGDTYVEADEILSQP